MMTYNEEFVRQVEVLLRCLPSIRNQADFALKGGTAINLFIQNLPRLSVDIDLTYCHISDRATSLNHMQECLRAIASEIKRTNPEFIIKEKLSQESNLIIKLFIFYQRTFVKIEPNFNMRGTLYPVELGNLSQNTKDYFNFFIDKVPMLAKAEVYAGKICAGLNRQHPRDLFDIKLLLEDGGITDAIREAFVVYLACDVRPIHELLSPHRLDISNVFQNEFLKMTDIQVSLEHLIQVREELIDCLAKSLTENEREFLLSVKNGDPKYYLLPFDNLDQLPALRWKVLNIKRMNKEKHIQMIAKLKSVLNIA